MKKLLILVSFLGIASFAFANPPTIDLSKAFNVANPTKKAVQFPHAVHQKNNQCTDCHMDAKGGKKLKAANGSELVIKKIKGTNHAVHKDFCWPCHEKKQVKAGKSCNTCHK
ncbi:MAG: cytochrome c family protein [Deferribacterales bacterium]